jgi:type II secretory pathway pseudopilin PulG
VNRIEGFSMRKRAAFTLVEMLVSMALILFIMVILSQAFTTGLGVFRQLKGLGDMEERLRSTSQILRRDLAAYHFENYRKLSDPTFWSSDGPPKQGFLRILQSTPIVVEGNDGDSIPSTRATSHLLHFTSKLSGQAQGDFATSSLPALAGLPAQFTAGQDGRYNTPPALPALPTQYRGRWFEVAYFLRPAGITTGSSSVPLYTLYRRQRGIIDNANAIQNLTQLATIFPEIACQQNGSLVNFWIPDDLNNPIRRFGVDQTTTLPVDFFVDPITGKKVFTYPFLGETDNATLQGADLLLSDVISFEVKAWVPNVTTTDFLDILSVAGLVSGNPSFYGSNPLFNLAGPMAFDTWAPGASSNAPLTVNISALKITIRIWDAKTQQARQLSIIQDM